MLAGQLPLNLKEKGESKLGNGGGEGSLTAPIGKHCTNEMAAAPRSATTVDENRRE